MTGVVVVLARVVGVDELELEEDDEELELDDDVELLELVVGSVVLVVDVEVVDEVVDVLEVDVDEVLDVDELEVVVTASAVQLKPWSGTPTAASKWPMRRSSRCVPRATSSVLRRTTSTAPNARRPLAEVVGRDVESGTALGAEMLRGSSPTAIDASGAAGIVRPPLMKTSWAVRLV